MIVALWIIAICELIRIIQNTIQLLAIKADAGARENAYAEFIKNLKADDKEFVRNMLTEFEKEQFEKNLEEGMYFGKGEEAEHE